MPCLECIVSNMSGDFCTPGHLTDRLKAGETILLLDCRSQTEYTRCHIRGAINVSLPSLMLRRLKKGNLKMSCIIQNNEAKEKFTKLWKTHDIVLYDDNTTDPNANPCPGIIDLLLKNFKQEGSKASFLLGGISQFEDMSPELCVDQNNEIDDSLFGLCNLKLCEDSGIGTSDSECENLCSPSAMSPFPVEVLPNLYLGNAKTSADITQLKKYGIHYILNVTPNVPNMFETDQSFKYMQIPVSDKLSQNLSSFFPEAIHFIDEAREKEHGVLVHCLAGISRSVTVTVAYLMQKKHMTLNEAYDHVKRCKPNISPNFNFMGQLLDFERHLCLKPEGNNTNGNQQSTVEIRQT